MQYPEKLVIESTTRCNFKCQMCVKQSAGCRIEEGDLAPLIFSQCENLFSHVGSVMFTGIGEPLLNENLEHYLSRARTLMPEYGVRGFQTNGKLLTRERAVSLIRSGLNKICISVDSIMPGRFDAVRQGGRLSDVDQAFDALKAARQMHPDDRMEVGIEFVLMKKNMQELPYLVEWAEKREVDFILVSHLSAYEKSMEKEIAYLNNSHEALELFGKYQARAEMQGLDLNTYDSIRWKIMRTQKEDSVYDRVAAFKEEALQKGLYVNMFHLLSEDKGEYDAVRRVFDKARENAQKAGISLELPGIRPKTDRYCPFVETNTMFVSWDGKVSPCYFLWHKYAAVRNGYAKHVNPVIFGDLTQKPAQVVWQGGEYSSFRKKVLKYDYPNCHAWCETRCDYVLDEPFYQDCYINDIPCCDCYWGLGFFNCLT